ncbi:MAG: hypothetical protein Q9182_007060 [Xanthomendoza sp. 2 TL-2023]
MASESITVICPSSPSEDSPNIPTQPTTNPIVEHVKEVPFNGDIHRLREDIAEDLFRLEAAEIRDKAIRGLPCWTSPIINPATNAPWFKFQANGRYLEFLSLFLTGCRQVDIDFSSRHALILFLLNGLEKSHEEYAKRTSPEDLELLQMFSWDEFELQTWACFTYGLDGRSGFPPSVKDEDGKSCWFYDGICQIRQLAVHRVSTYRCNFSTHIIRCAAACALRLGNHEFLEQIELVTRVLYVEASQHFDYPATRGEAMTARKLLWPVDVLIETDHEFLDEIQGWAEVASYNFCKRHLPRDLAGFGCTVEQHFELPQWLQVIRHRWYSRDWISEEDQPFFAKISDKLRSVERLVRQLRNATAHRERLTFYPDDAERGGSKAERYVAGALEYVRALEDEDTAREIETLAAAVIPATKQRYLDWLDVKWCQGRDLQRILETTRARSETWGSLDYDEYSLVRQMYGRAYRRALHFQSILEPAEGLSPSSGDDVIPTAPASLGGWETYNNHNNNLEKVSTSPNAEGQYPSEGEQTSPASEEDSSSPSEESQSDTDDNNNSSPNTTDVDDDTDDDWNTPVDPQPQLPKAAAADDTIAPVDWPSDEEDEDDNNNWASDEDEADDEAATTSLDSSAYWPTLEDAEHIAAADQGIALGSWGESIVVIEDPPPTADDRDDSDCCGHGLGWAGCRLGRPPVTWSKW